MRGPARVPLRQRLPKTIRHPNSAALPECVQNVRLRNREKGRPPSSGVSPRVEHTTGRTITLNKDPERPNAGITAVQVLPKRPGRKAIGPTRAPQQESAPSYRAPRVESAPSSPAPRVERAPDHAAPRQSAPSSTGIAGLVRYSTPSQNRSGGSPGPSFRRKIWRKQLLRRSQAVAKPTAATENKSDSRFQIPDSRFRSKRISESGIRNLESLLV